LTRGTGVAALSTIVGVTAGIDTNAVAGGTACSIDTGFFCSTDLAALAAVALIAMRIDADSATTGGPRAAEIATTSTVARIVLGVYAVAVAVGLTSDTVLLAVAVGADLAGRASIATTSTVVKIVLQVHTGAVASDLIRAALTTALGTDLAGRASIAAMSTVVGIVERVRTGAIASDLVWGTLTTALGTDLTRGTSVATPATVVKIVLEIHTVAIAIRGAIRTSEYFGDHRRCTRSCQHRHHSHCNKRHQIPSLAVWLRGRHSVIGIGWQSGLRRCPRGGEPAGGGW
jgi:hypothetical protein